MSRSVQTDTEKKIAEIREALEKATPGPWKWVDPGGYARKALVGEREIMNFGASMPYSEVAGQEPDDADAHLIANAPEWLRFLLSEYERSEEFRSWAYENIDRLQTELDQKDEENRKLRKELDKQVEIGFSFECHLQSAQQEIEALRQERNKLIEGLLTIMNIASEDGVHWKLDRCYTTARNILEEVGVLSR